MMMKVVKYDPINPSRGRSKSYVGMQTKCKMSKRVDGQLKAIENAKTISPLMFRHIRVNEMTSILRQDQIPLNTEGYNNDGRKNQHNPLVIKTDPRYNNSQLEISTSSKKLNDYAGSKNRKLKFLPSISNRLPSTVTTTANQRNMETDKFLNLGIIDFKGTGESKIFRGEIFELPNSPTLAGEEPENSQNHVRSEMGTFRRITGPDCFAELPCFNRKFSSDVRLKLNKNNAQLQTIQGYSTCTFRVKMNGKNRIEHRNYE